MSTRKFYNLDGTVELREIAEEPLEYRIPVVDKSFNFRLSQEDPPPAFKFRRFVRVVEDRNVVYCEVANA